VDFAAGAAANDQDAMRVLTMILRLCLAAPSDLLTSATGPGAWMIVAGIVAGRLIPGKKWKYRDGGRNAVTFADQAPWAVLS
jgi:hypothetical protein